MQPGNTLIQSGFALLVILAFVVWAQIDYRHLSIWTREDAPLEDLTAIFFALSSVFFVVVAVRSDFLRLKTKGWRYFWIVAWALLMFVFAGEEISWGQRIFEIETPAWIGQSNYQNEITIHNHVLVKETIGGIFGVVALVMILAGGVIPLLARTAPVRRLLHYFALSLSPTRLLAVLRALSRLRRLLHPHLR